MKLYQFLVASLVLISAQGQSAQKISNGFNTHGAQLATVEVARGRFDRDAYGENGQPSARSGYAISPDSRYAVFRSDQKRDELFSIPIQGGKAIPLSASLGKKVSADSFRVTHDSTRVVFNAYDQQNKTSGLYVVPITGGTPTKLLSSEDGASPSSLFSISSDNKYIALVVTKKNPNPKWQNYHPIYRVPLEGGKPKQITDRGNYDISHFKISSDNQSIVFRSDRERIDKYELYSVPSKGGKVVKLNVPLTNGSEISIEDIALNSRSRVGFDISSDSRTVVFSTNNESKRIYNLFSVPIRGGTQTKLNVPSDRRLVSRGVGDENRWEIASDGKYVIYHDGASHGKKDGIASLYSVPINGGGARILNRDPDTNAVLHVYGFRLIPDGNDVLFFTHRHIYKANHANAELSLVSANPSCAKFISADNDAFVTLDTCLREDKAVHSTSIATKKRNTLISGLSYISDVRVTPDRTHVVYQAHLSEDSGGGFYVASLTEDKVTDISPPMLSRVVDYFISRDSKYILYKGIYKDGGLQTLFSHRIAN